MTNEEIIKGLIEKVEDKEIISQLSVLQENIKTEKETFKKQEDEYLNTIAKWRDAYKESILKGGFQTKESVQEKVDPIEKKIPTFEELLSKFAK